ncbi:MAG: PTS sugar transporter subunit IIA [candidate division Zixibacteria bacterium]|nr:PTS sugar transporter subunit IIA [candidate division Zixibacteria bacterium]
MNISRLLDPGLIKLSMETQIDPDPEGRPRTDKQKRSDKETVLDELVSLLERSGRIGNRTKLLTDFINRERKASTATGHGIAVPHVRTYQAKELTIAVARSQEGYDFDAPDGEPVRLFFAMAAPSYEETVYLKVFKSLAEVLRFDYFRQRLLDAESEYDFIRAFQEME